MGYLCKYLRGTGWEPVVLTEKMADQTFMLLEDVCTVHAIQYYPEGKGIRSHILRTILLILSVAGLKTYIFKRRAQQLFAFQQFNIILCSAYRSFPLGVAASTAKRLGLPWIADLRDIVEQYSGLEFVATKLPGFIIKNFGRIIRRRFIVSRNRALSSAACATTVSDFHVKALTPYCSAVRLIYNGYDPELFRPRYIPTNKFIVVYTGRLISPAMRDPSLLFQSIRRLSAEGLFTPETFQVQWYTDPASQREIEAEATAAEVSPYMDYRSYVPASQIPDILAASSIVLLLANKSCDGGPRGVVTTKIFEAMGCERPILCVRSDEDVIASLLSSTGCGQAASTLHETCQFVERLYNEWLECGYTSVKVNRTVIESFSRSGQAKQFIDVFEEFSAGGNY
jgi:glycosyltransferase involved in cell wall biosynthesis